MPVQQDHIARNETSKIIEIKAVNSSGKGVTGLIFSDLKVRYWARGQAGAGSTADPVANGSNDTYLSNGWKEVSAANLAGVYQYGIPNAVLQSSSSKVYISFEFDSGSIADVIYEINLTLISTYLGSKLSADGLDGVPIEGLTAKEALTYMASVLCGETEGAETALTIFKAIGDNSTSRLSSQSDDELNRTGVSLL